MIRRLAENDLLRVYDIYQSAVGRSKFPTGSGWGKKEFQAEFENGHGWVLESPEHGLESFVFVRQNGDAWEITARSAEEVPPNARTCRD